MDYHLRMMIIQLSSTQVVTEYKDIVCTDTILHITPYLHYIWTKYQDVNIGTSLVH